MKTKISLFILLFCVTFQSNSQEIVNINVSQLNIDGVDQIELTWQSIDEYLWCHFIVERDINNQGNFIPVDTLSANGNTIGSLNYLFTDIDVQSGNSYCYRLSLDTLNPMNSQCYFNRISDTVCINFFLSIGEYGFSSPCLYPNPFSSQITLQTEIPLVNATLSVFNSNGKLVKQIENISGHTNTLYRDNLPNGLYFMRLTEGNKALSVDKLIIVDE